MANLEHQPHTTAELPFPTVAELIAEMRRLVVEARDTLAEVLAAHAEAAHR